MRIFSKKILFFLSLTILLSFLLEDVYAIGVGPSRIVVDFEPNLKKTFTYNVINNEGREIQVEMYVKGALKDYVTLHQTSGKLATREVKVFSFELSLPSMLETPGTYDTRIGVVETLPTIRREGATVGARAGVEMQLWVKVPYPGKYIEIALTAANIKLGEPADFTISISNLGELDVTAKDDVTIFDPSNNLITTVYAGEAFIKSKETGKLFATWTTTKDVKPGTYRAVATVKYDGKNATTQKTFKVGELLLDIVDIKVDKIKKGSIARFEIEMQSFWNEKIFNVYVELEIFDGKGNKIATVKSESVDIEAWQRKTVSAYWDTKGLEVGKYGVKTILHYDNKTAEKTIQAEIIAFEVSAWMVVAGAGVIVILVIYLKKLRAVKVRTWKRKRQSQS